MKEQEEITNVVDHVIINGSTFELWGVSNHDSDLHLHIRSRGETPDDVVNAVDAGEEPIKIYDKEGRLVYSISDYASVSRYSVDYSCRFTPTDIGVAIDTIVSKKKVTPAEITDLQLAIAELAALITEAE